MSCVLFSWNVFFPHLWYGEVFSPEPPGLHSTAASSMPLRISVSLYAVVCVAMVSIKTPHQTLRNVITPYLPTTNLWDLCCTGPSAQQVALLQLSCTLHGYSLLWSCWAKYFPKPLQHFPLSFLAPLLSSCFSQGFVPVNLNCAVKGSFHGNEQLVLKCGDNKDKVSPLWCFLVHLIKSNHTVQQNR